MLKLTYKGEREISMLFDKYEDGIKEMKCSHIDSLLRVYIKTYYIRVEIYYCLLTKTTQI